MSTPDDKKDEAGSVGDGLSSAGSGRVRPHITLTIPPPGLQLGPGGLYASGGLPSPRGMPPLYVASPMTPVHDVGGQSIPLNMFMAYPSKASEFVFKHFEAEKATYFCVKFANVTSEVNPFRGNSGGRDARSGVVAGPGYRLNIEPCLVRLTTTDESLRLDPNLLAPAWTYSAILEGEEIPYLSSTEKKDPIFPNVWRWRLGQSLSDNLMSVTLAVAAILKVLSFPA
ncbi:hypothetical protein AAG570_009654 [Ranatra chinensis]|uniref:Uncharacterized protein n=1 Tax=Ranatra chinensis TaxID=642074 RepID=A0ABD0YRV0_9HEMI